MLETKSPNYPPRPNRVRIRTVYLLPGANRAFLGTGRSWRRSRLVLDMAGTDPSPGPWHVSRAGIWSSPPAHRIAYHLEYGVPPQGHVIWRDCSNPLCVNPRHLRAGDRGTFRRSMTSRSPRE